jgi:hypothetical protein
MATAQAARSTFNHKGRLAENVRLDARLLAPAARRAKRHVRINLTDAA